MQTMDMVTMTEDMVVVAVVRGEKVALGATRVVNNEVEAVAAAAAVATKGISLTNSVTEHG
jgi:hypothetical protein